MASRLFVPSDPTESGGSVWRRYLLQPTGWLPLLIGAILLVVVNVQGYSLQWNWWVLLMTTFAVGLPLLPLHFSITRWSEFLVMRSKIVAKLRLPLVSANRLASWLVVVRACVSENPWPFQSSEYASESAFLKFPTNSSKLSALSFNQSQQHSQSRCLYALDRVASVSVRRTQSALVRDTDHAQVLYLSY